jgi:hypothetical protein
VSVFAIVILSIIAGLYRSGHEEFVGGQEDPEDGKAVAGTIFTAVIVYAVGFLIPIHSRRTRAEHYNRSSWFSVVSRASSTSARTAGARSHCLRRFDG